MRFNRSNQSYVDTTVLSTTSDNGVAVGMTERNGRLVIILTDGSVQVRNSSSLSLITIFTVSGAKDVAILSDDTMWIVAGTKIRRYSATGTDLGDVIDDVVKPGSISVDNFGRLVVCENGPLHQVLFYSSTARVATFGTEGGINAGTAGQVQPLKFWNLAGAGTDSSGNIYVALCGAIWDGLRLRKFTSTGNLVWELKGDHFLDSVVVDPASDGADVYGSEEHYSMNASAVGANSDTLVGYTFNPDSTDDPRTDGSLHASWARRINGKLFLYMTNMYHAPIQIYGFHNGEQAQHDLSFSTFPWGWGRYVDKNATIWESDGLVIHKTPLTGLDASDKPVYGTTVTQSAPSTFTSIERLEYDSPNDVMYLAGYTPALPRETWGVVGRVLARYNNWSTGNRTAAWTIDLVSDSANNLYMKTMTTEGD